MFPLLEKDVTPHLTNYDSSLTSKDSDMKNVTSVYEENISKTDDYFQSILDDVLKLHKILYPNIKFDENLTSMQTAASFPYSPIDLDITDLVEPTESLLPSNEVIESLFSNDSNSALFSTNISTKLPEKLSSDTNNPPDKTESAAGVTEVDNKLLSSKQIHHCPEASSVLQWQNKDNSCWLDVILHCLVNSIVSRTSIMNSTSSSNHASSIYK